MEPQTPKTENQEIEQHTLELIRELVEELGIQQAVRVVSLDASLDRDLGLGSLERVELFIRVENAFSVRFPDRDMAEVDTPRDLVQTLLQLKTSRENFKFGHRMPIGKAALSPEEATSLDEVLRRYAMGEPRRPHIFLQTDEGDEEVITYGKLFETASQVANGLLERGLKRGETVAIMLPTGREFFSVFFGVLLAGGIVVPIYPPYKADRIEEYATRQARILRNASIRFLVTFQKVETLGGILRPFIPTLKEVMTVEKLSSSHSPPPILPNQGWEAALIQYTSGSTSDPKGVLLAHENILSNIQAIGKGGQISPLDIAVSWLPLYHDMGLIGSWLCCLYFGIPITILSPFSFLNRPERWLWAIHYHRATISAAPNFAYELCLRRIEAKAIEGLDLSSWRLAFNGAEAINPDTLARFVDRFAPYGFRENAFFPVFGLAEVSVALTFPPVGRPPLIDRISRDGFQTHQRAEPAPSSDLNPLKFVSCGVPLPGHEIRIVDSQGKELGEREIGSLHFRGPSAMKGYFQSPKATQAVFHEGWWDTGDLAYRAGGEFFITGREKDVIIKAGRNIYPQEIEEIASEVPGIRRGCVAAFGVSEQRLGTERVVVVAETRETEQNQRDKISSQVVERVSEKIGIPPDVVLLIPPGAIPKTSSGKLRRASCRDSYLKGKLVLPPHPVWVQIAKLYVNGFLSWVKNGIETIGRYGYAAYVGLMVCFTVPPVWFIIFLFPKKQLAAGLSHVWSKGFLKLIGCPLSVQGEEQLGRHPQMVLVANHASYLDAVVLMAVLPPGFLFVAKNELVRAPIIRTVIRIVGHLTVDREDLSKSVSDAKKIEEALQAGSSVLIFPEATFTPVTGLRPFKLGAFKVAVETSQPICPISIRGTRHVLWGDQWIPRRGPISVVIGEPIIPQESSWREITRLRDLAKTEIAKHCGENPLNLVGAGPPPS